MAGKSTYFANWVLDNVPGVGDFWLALLRGLPTGLYETPSTVNELSTTTDTGYVRTQMPRSIFTPAVNGERHNSVDVIGPTCTEFGGWGTSVVGWAIFDDQAAGRLLWWAECDPYSLFQGDNVTFPIGSIILTED